MSNILPKLMLSNKLAIKQKIHRVVQGSPTYTVVLILHLNVKRLNVEMIFLIINFIEYSETFRGFTVPVLLQVFSKDLLNLVFGFNHITVAQTVSEYRVKL